MQLKQKVSLTGYRILFVLKILLKHPASKKEILSELSLNPYITKVSKDSLRMDINTLKQAGFIIKSPIRSNGYRYELDFNPIKFKLDENELRVINSLKDTVINLSNWKYIVNLFSVLEKISKFMEEDDITQSLLNFNYFLNVDFKLLKELNVLTNNKSEVIVQYNSPHSGIKNIKLRLCYIKYDGGKLHIYGKSLKYPNFISLRLDHVVKIVKIIKMKSEIDNDIFKKIIYKVKSDAFETSELLENEKIITKNGEYIEIEANIANEFMFIQRLLSMADKLLYIEDDEIRKRLIKTLKNIKRIYNAC